MDRLAVLGGIGLAIAGTSAMALIIAPMLPPRQHAPPTESAKIVGRIEPEQAPVAPELRSNLIRTVPITRPPPGPPAWLKENAQAPKSEPAPAVAAVEEEPPPRRHWHIGSRRLRLHATGGDLCSRTGGVRIETHNGRSWRCRYR